jgi:phosphinothricin acetyltransferase
MSAALRIREADPRADAAACARIYAPYVSGSVATFEEADVPGAEMARRMAASYDWLVAEEAGGVVGYAYASRHHPRAAYRWAADVAIYVDPARRGGGVGRALYGELIPRLRDLGLWTLCAGVTMPNAASEGLHRAMGFEPVGTWRNIGYKHGAWHDVAWFQLDLRPDSRTPPSLPAEPRFSPGA